MTRRVAGTGLPGYLAALSMNSAIDHTAILAAKAGPRYCRQRAGRAAPFVLAGIR